MKKIICFLTALFIFNTNVCAKPLDNSKIGALGAILMDAPTGRVLWEKNSHRKLAMASTTKIMTAIIALENANMNDSVTVSKSVLSVPQVKLNLSPGEKIKLQYLMYALMLESSNDAAVAIAEHIGTNVDGFCKMMNEKAKKIGALDTIFETPNGLDKGQHHSTAYDMALIARYALNNPKFISLINTPSATFSSNKKTYTVNNKNRLLREFNGANGIKTGFTGKAGHCFVGAAKQNDMQLISVVLGSGWGNKGKEGKWSDTKKILDYGFKNYKYKHIITKGLTADYTKIKHSRTPNIALIYEKNLILPVSGEEEKKINVKIEAPKILEAPVNKNDVIGSAKIFIGNEYAKINLLADNSAPRHDLKTSLEKILNEWINIGDDFGFQ